MADRSKNTILAVGGIAILVVVGGFWLVRSGGSNADTQASSAASAGESNDIPYVDVEPVSRNGAPGTAQGTSRLTAADTKDEVEPEEEGQYQSKKRKAIAKKRQKNESKQDEHGIYRFENGKIDRKKMPPMGG